MRILFTVLRHAILYFQIIFSITKKIIYAPQKDIRLFNDFKKENHKFIFIYAGILGKLDQSGLNLLNTAKDLGAYVVLITNNKNFTIENKNKYLIDIFIDNKSNGWDFSQYKTVTQYIASNLKDEVFSKVIYANDSTFYLNEGLAETLIKFLDKKSDFIATFENSGSGKYHFSSWLFSIDKRIFFNEKFLLFWKKFKDVKNKYHAIHYGEHKLSKTLFEITNKVGLIYPNIFLMELIQSNKITHHDFGGAIIETYLSSKKEIDLSDHIQMNLWKYSPLHIFSILLLKKIKFPFIKKDFFWYSHSNSYSSMPYLFDVLEKKIQPDYFLEIKKYFILRGRLVDSTVFKKIKSALGLI